MGYAAGFVEFRLARCAACSRLVALLGQFLDQLVEVRLEQSVLHDVIFFKLAPGVGVGDLGRNLAGILQNFPISDDRLHVEMIRLVVFAVGGSY